jgi:hypothetical protein
MRPRFPASRSFEVCCQITWACVPNLQSQPLLSHSETVGAPSLRFLQGRVRCRRYYGLVTSSGLASVLSCAPSALYPSTFTHRGGWPGLSHPVFFFTRFKTVGAPSLRFLQGRVRCRRYYGLVMSSGLHRSYPAAPSALYPSTFTHPPPQPFSTAPSQLSLPRVTNNLY